MDDDGSDSGVSSGPIVLRDQTETLRKRHENAKFSRFLRSQQSSGRGSNSVPRLDDGNYSAAASSSSMAVSSNINAGNVRSVGDSGSAAVCAAAGAAETDGTLRSTRLMLARFDLNKNG